MLRMLFEKQADAVWISHLDLMRVFQRAFRRAGLMLKHSQGFTPRAIVSIALPLSVGVKSVCELLDVELEGETPPVSELTERVNAALPAGIRVLETYEAARKIKELTTLKTRLYLEYDKGIPAATHAAIAAMLCQESLIMEKHSRKGTTETDLLPLLKQWTMEQLDEHTLMLELLVCAQNPSLNPQLIANAIEKYLPYVAPDFAYHERVEVYDEEGNIFR